MPELLDDDVDNIKEGTYVYWMHQDEEVPRGSLGEVIEVDGEDRRVRFPKAKLQLPARKLNVSDFQKGALVHRTKDGRSEETGEVKGLEDGKLIIEVDGKTREEKAKYLMKCDFQPGMFVFWRLQDKYVPVGHVGKVLGEVDIRGKIKVAFPEGAWFFKSRDLVKALVQPGSYVQWNKSDDEIAEGEIGEATGEVNERGKIRVAFSKGTWSFAHDDLIPCELQLGAFVKWQKMDEDVKKGDIGQVVGIKTSQSRLRVQFPKGRWKFRANELSLCRIQPGNLVKWNKSDEDIMRGDIGEVVRLEGNRLSIQWPQGHWSMKVNEIEKFRFQKGDRVQWTKSDDDIPEGHIGVVMGVRYDEDAEDSGKRLYVTWPKGRWSMKPHTLQALNFDTEGANQLKLSFKRFDLDGDGKLSEDELVTVLGSLGGEGAGLAPDECRQLFKALDKDENGKLTVSEFIDYVFSDASAASKVVLADGFGLDAFLGFPDEEEERYEEDDNDEEKGQPFEKPMVLKSFFTPGSETIDLDTDVSLEEWVTAMLTVGVPREAGLDSYLAVLGDLGYALGDPVKLEDLAAELNGMGGTAGVAELRDPIWKVKNGEVDLIDLDTPSETVDFERDLAKKTGIDALIFDLVYNHMSLKAAADHLPQAKLSDLERKVLGEMSPEDLLEAVVKGWMSSDTLSAVASWQSARESCKREVQAIIDRCKSEGTAFRDESWNPLKNEAEVLYVDREKPGWDCTVSKPEGWERAKDVRDVDSPCIVAGGAQYSDVGQGQIGDCFFIAALAAVAANRKSFLRQALVAYDEEVGVYGVMFCEEMHFVYEIVDDLFAVDQYKRLKYASSANSHNEFWVSIIEKAYFKHMTCLEMCDGGWGPEAVFSLVGGVSGVYPVTDKEFRDPSRLFATVDSGLENGEIMTTCFFKPSKGKYAHLEDGEDGQCGESGMGLGLVENHAYSTVRSAEIDGNQLICFRNPWAQKEWKGPWSDESEEWTSELRGRLGLKTKDDRKFWMAAEDFVQLARSIKFNRTFGPTWQCCAQYGSFGKAPPFTALARNNYRACEDNEISFKRGEVLEVTKDSGFWLYGVHKETEKEGYIRKKDVDIKCQDTFKYQLTMSKVASDARIIVGVFRQNQKKMREWSKRKQDGMNYKDTDYPSAYMHIFDSNDTRIVNQRLGSQDRAAWQYLNPSQGPFKVYVSCKATAPKRFALYAFSPHGELHWEALDCDRESWMKEVGQRNAVDTMRENIYTDTHNTLDEYFHLGYQLMNDYPDVARQVRHVASTISDMVDSDGIRCVAEGAADRVKNFVNSDQVQSVTNKVKDIIGSEEAQEMVNQVGNFMNRAKSWWG